MTTFLRHPAAHDAHRPSVESHDVFVRYDGTVVLSGVSLRLNRGDLAAIVGPTARARARSSTSSPGSSARRPARYASMAAGRPATSAWRTCPSAARWTGASPSAYTTW